MVATDLRGIEGNLGNIGDRRGIVAQPIELSPEEIAANAAVDTAGAAVMKARDALASAQKDFDAAQANAQAVSDKVAADRAAKAAQDLADASSKAAAAAKAQADALALEAQAAADQAAADDAKKVATDKAASLHTLNTKPI